MQRLDELLTLKDTETRGSITCLGCSVIASLMVAAMVKANVPVWKVFATASGFTAGVIGLVSGKQAEQARLKLQDWQDVSDAAFTTNLVYEMSPKMLGKTSVTSNPTVELFDWDTLRRERDKYPHLLLLGKTGSGKSILAERLCSMLGGSIIAVAPHYKRGDYQSANLIIGSGRNVGESMLPYSEEPQNGKSQNVEVEVSFNDVVSGIVSPNASQFMNALLREMDRRYQLVDPETGEPDETGIYTYEYEGGRVYNIILDETPVLAKIPGWRDVFSKLIREARKVGLRLIVLTQGKEVKALGIEGEGSIRESLTFVWLYPFVEDEAQRILGTKKTDEEKAYWSKVVSLLKDNEYSCLVEDKFALTPVSQAWLDARSQTFNTPKLSAVPDGKDTQVPNPSIVINNHNSAVSTSKAVSSSPETQELREQLWRVARDGFKDGLTRSEVIKKRLGYKSERYNKGIELLKELESEFGNLSYKSGELVRDIADGNLT